MERNEGSWSREEAGAAAAMTEQELEMVAGGEGQLSPNVLQAVRQINQQGAPTHDLEQWADKLSGIPAPSPEPYNPMAGPPMP